MTQEVALIKVLSVATSDLGPLPATITRHIAGLEILAEVCLREVEGNEITCYKVGVRDIVEAITPTAPVSARWLDLYCRGKCWDSIVFPASFVSVTG